MSTDSAQTVITVVFSVLIITDIVGNTRVCVVIIKNQGMRWDIMEKFELLLTSFGLTAIFIDMRFSAINRTSWRPSCVSLPLVDPVTCVLQHRSSDRVLHYRNLRLYLNLGLKLKRVHRVLQFKQYIYFNTQKRTVAKIILKKTLSSSWITVCSVRQWKTSEKESTSNLWLTQKNIGM